MIVAWMLYCLGCAAGLAAAAAIAERALLAGRVAVRGVWIGAVALSIVIPVAAFELARGQRDVKSNMSVSQFTPVNTALDSLPAADLPLVAHTATPPAPPSLRARLSWWDGPLAGAWVALSVALAAYFGAGMIALLTMRRRWRREILLGVDVLVSERTGPALVGTFSPAIVLPEWTLAMDRQHLSLMLRHEQEHRRAGDGQLLTVAQLALVLMPWNAALWWQIVRLRMAVELDCDARVLRSADVRSYGDLLLEVARPRAALQLVGVTAFAERATQLERRIRLMRRRRDGLPGAARAGVAAIGIIVLSVAWVAPRPPVPPRAIAHVASPPLATRPLPTLDTIPQLALALSNPRSSTADTGEARRSDSSVIAAPIRATTDTARSVPAATDAQPPASVAPLPTAAAQSNPVALPPLRPTSIQKQQVVDDIFHALFDGIVLTADQESQARALLARLEDEQSAQDQIVLNAVLATAPRRQAIQAQRDSALRALVTSDVDRATFDARIAPPTGGRGGRGAGPPPTLDSLGRGRGVGRSGGPAPGRGGGRGAPIPDVVDATFHRLFDGIALTPEQESSARATLTTTQETLRALALPPITTRLAFRRAQGLVMIDATSDSTLAALVTNDADRAALQSRVGVLAPPPPPPRP